jgi:hypothetical protein
MVIQYADQLTIPRSAVFEIVKVFRSSKDTNERLLTLVTLYKIQDAWAMDFLSRHRRFEKDPRVRQLCCNAVNIYYAKLDSDKAEKSEKVLAQAADKVINKDYAKAARMLEIEKYGF